MEISAIDKNFKIETSIDKPNIKFYNVLESPFSIHGVFYENGKFRRLPEDVAKTVSEGVYSLHANTAGGRVRFSTDSRYVAVHFKGGCGRMPHFTFAGSAGFDMYRLNDEEKEQYVGTFVPPITVSDGFEGVKDVGEKKMRSFTINFPTYSGISELYIGLEDEAVVEPHRNYKFQKPIVYYGSSITQGGCCSRPGNSYQSIISRRFDADFINLGFSGNAKGEKEIYDYIKKLDMCAFVYDYDHNAPTPEHLEKTHEPMFEAIRKANPNLPIIIMSRPVFSPNEDDSRRREIINTTYEHAVKSGDKNVFFIDGKTLMKVAENDGTVDGCHPNDLGFYSMAKALGDVLQTAVYC